MDLLLSKKRKGRVDRSRGKGEDRGGEEKNGETEK